MIDGEYYFLYCPGSVFFKRREVEPMAVLGFPRLLHVSDRVLCRWAEEERVCLPALHFDAQLMAEVTLLLKKAALVRVVPLAVGVELSFSDRGISIKKGGTEEEFTDFELHRTGFSLGKESQKTPAEKQSGQRLDICWHVMIHERRVTASVLRPPYKDEAPRSRRALDAILAALQDASTFREEVFLGELAAPILPYISIRASEVWASFHEPTTRRGCDEMSRLGSPSRVAAAHAELAQVLKAGL